MRPALPPAFLHAPIAHRGFHDKTAGRPENSPAAFLAAVNAGYGIECDLQLSSDAQPMVFHDEALERLTGQPGLIRDRSAIDLARVALLHGSDTVPTLAQMLTLVAGRVPLLIEIKDQQGEMGQTDGLLEEATAKALAGYKGPLALMSFNPHSVARMAALMPDTPRGLVTSAYDPEDWAPLPGPVCAHLREIPDYDTAGCSFISHEARDLARPRVAELRAQGAAILCWTIRTPGQEAQARKIAQNITFEGYRAVLPA